MSHRSTHRTLLSVAATAMLALAGGGCGDRSSEAAAPAGAERGYPLEGVCIYDPAGTELCGQKGADWCKTYIAQRDEVRVNEDDVDVLEIGCEAYTE